VCKLNRFETAAGAVSGTEIPSHYLKVCSVQLLGNTPPVLNGHHLIVRVNVGYVLAVYIDIWHYFWIHGVSGIAKLEMKAVEPIFSEVGNQRK
jgi:hypothetical protein